MTQKEITRLSPECMADLCFRLHEIFYPLVSISKIETNQKKLTNHLGIIFNQTIIDTITNLGAKDREDLISNICGITDNTRFSDIDFHKLLHLQLGIYGVIVPENAINQITGEERFQLNSQLVGLLEPISDRLRTRTIVLRNDDLSTEFRLSGFLKETEFEMGIDGIVYKIHRDRINIDEIMKNVFLPILNPLGISQGERFSSPGAANPAISGKVSCHLRKSNETSMLEKDRKVLVKASSRFIIHHTDIDRILRSIIELGLKSEAFKSFTPGAKLEDASREETIVPLEKERTKK